MSFKLLFIGRSFTKRQLEMIKDDSNGSIGFSNHNFETSIIRGLVNHRECDVQIITVPGFYTYPCHSKTFYVKKELAYTENIKVISIGFCNLTGIHYISVVLNLLGELLRYSFKNKSKNDKIHILINTPKSRLLLPAIITKILLKNYIKISLIIPDIPSMITSFNKSGIVKRKIINFIDAFSMYLSSKCDSYILLTEQMKNFYDKPIKYIVMEGLVDEKYYGESNIKKQNDKLVLLYTGSLNKFFGIENLIEAFNLINSKDVELWICGSGDFYDYVDLIAKNNSKVKFFGLVDINKARELQMQADILINPRGPEGEYTKYSFPSKTLEYLACGKVVIMNRLPGVPSEYYNYVIAPKENSIQSLADAIKSVINMSESERLCIGRKGKEFVISQKNSYSQVAKILDFIRINQEV